MNLPATPALSVANIKKDYLMITRKFVLFVMFISLMSACSSTTQNKQQQSDIKLLAIAPQPLTEISAESTITAQLEYWLVGDDINVDDYFVSIQFDSTRPNATFAFSPTNLDEVKLTEPQGMVTLQFPISEVWNRCLLQKPVTAYYYLHKKLGENRSRVIAKTVGIQYSHAEHMQGSEQSCQ